MHSRDVLSITIVILFATALFWGSNNFFKGSLRSIDTFAKEISSPSDSVQLYKLATQAPFKYRVVFPAIVKSTYRMVGGNSPRSFFGVYKFWSWLFYVVSPIMLYVLLRRIKFNASFSLAGALIFMLLPAFLFAFTLPVHTREDTLGYTLLLVGLIMLIEKRWLYFMLVSVIAALTRENLLLLPLLYFFYSGDDNWIRRFLLPAVPAAIWIGFRFIYGFEAYDTWLGLRWNLDNPEQVIGFLFVTFNVCWIPFLLYLLNKKPVGQNAGVAFFHRTAFPTLMILLVTTFVGGIFNEIRLLYLFAPWAIVITLTFIKDHKDLLVEALSAKFQVIYSAVVLCVFVGSIFLLSRSQMSLIKPGKWDVPYDLWIFSTAVYLLIFMLALPTFVNVYLRTRRAP